MKTKFKISLSIFALLMAVFFAACQKEEIQTPENGTAPALSNNSMGETIGQNHNAILDALGQHSSFSASFVNGPAGPVANVMAPITEQITGITPNDHQNTLIQTMLDIKADVANMNSMADAGTWAYNNGTITADDLSATNTLSSIMDNGLTGSGQATFQQDLLNFETSVLNNSALSANGRQTLLIASAVMRYSDNFWNNVRATGPNGPWHGIDYDRLQGVPDWVKRDAMAAYATASCAPTWYFGPWVGAGIVAGAAAIASAT